VTGVGSALLDWLTGGSALAALGKVLAAVSALVFGIIYRRYLGILGADRRRSAERQAYDALRKSIAQGNMAARLYAERLTQFLDWIDRFFGDAGMADRTLFPRAFGLRTPAPLWTAPAFDRCLLIAMIYPVLTIFIVWVVSGHVGSAEAAFGLKAGASGWQRGAATIGLGLVMVTTARFSEAIDRKLNSWVVVVWFAIFFSIFLINIKIFGAMMIVITAIPMAVFLLQRTLLPILLAITVFIFVILANHNIIIRYITIGFGTLFCYLIPNFINYIERRGWYVVFVILLLLISIVMVLGFAVKSSLSPFWDSVFGPFLLYLVFLTALNAPFDWASLGLTRALLRRGLELRGWWPYALAIVDAALAALIIAALTLTTVVGVQAFDALAVYGGGGPVLPLDNLFDGIEAHPGAPEYWWLYSLLLSTMIPSLVNLVIGGASLAQGVPGLPALLLRFIPAQGAVARFERVWIALVLTTQVALGAVLGIAAQGLLAVGIIGYILPLFGGDLLDMARDVAAFNLPARVGQLFGVSL
jgi:hypothetical protein